MLLLQLVLWLRNISFIPKHPDNFNYENSQQQPQHRNCKRQVKPQRSFCIPKFKDYTNSSRNNRKQQIRNKKYKNSQSKREVFLHLLLFADAGVEGFGFFGVASVREDVADVFCSDAALRIACTPSLHVTFKRFIVTLLRKVNLP